MLLTGAQWVVAMSVVVRPESGQVTGLSGSCPGCERCPGSRLSLAV